MKFISIREAIKKGKGKLAIRGWVYRERGSNKFKFIVLRDSTNIVQCVLKKEDFFKNWREIDGIQIEASMEIEGTIKKDKRAPTGYEIHVKKYKLIGPSDDFPIYEDESFESLLDKRHLWLRSRYMTSILKIRSTIFGAIHEFFRKNGFYEFQSPLLIPGIAEEAGTLFEVNYYGKKINLAQTWQFYAEAAMYGLEKIYTVAPSFRAEKSKTSRHLTEYWHTEVEAAWMNLEELMDLAENLVKYVIKKVLKENKEELEILGRDSKPLQNTLKKKWLRITYDKALKLLKEKKKLVIKWGKDLRTVEEEALVSLYKIPVFITNYPKQVMAFYKPKDPKNPKTARCFDLIIPDYKELIGASERCTDIEELIESLKRVGDKPEKYKWYLDLNKYGKVPHAGFGLGTERLIAWICGLKNIKDAIPFPRTPDRFTP